MQLFKKKAYTLYYDDAVACSDCVAQNVTIGTQVWTKCNLDVTTYRDGTTIPQVTDPTAWSTLTTGAWCYHENNSTNNTTYGKLYNWYAVVGIHDAASLTDPAQRKMLAPTGYHVPSDAEWTILTDYLGGLSVAGGKLKEEGLCHWTDPNEGATNSSGFTAFAGGNRYWNGLIFQDIGLNGFWWSSSEYDTTGAWYRLLDFNTATAFRSYSFKRLGQSVRLIQDEVLSCLTIEVYPPIFNPGTSHVVEYLDCDGISQIVIVPDGGTMVTICATEIIENNLNGLTQPLYTLCSPPEPQELDFTLSQTCDGEDITLTADNITGGTGPYVFSTTVFTNSTDALDNTLWTTALPSNDYPVGNVPGEYWVSIKDSLGVINASGVQADCTSPPEFDFTLSQTCSGLDITLVANSIVGGTGPYQFSTTIFSNMTDALDNTTWATASSSKNYPVGNAPGTYWVSIKDSLGMITASVIDADCWDPETVTRYQISVSSSTAATSNGVCGFNTQTVWIATRNPQYAQLYDVVFTAQTGPTRYDGSGGVADWRKYISAPGLVNSNPCFNDPNCTNWTEAIRINSNGEVLELGCCNPPC